MGIIALLIKEEYNYLLSHIPILVCVLISNYLSIINIIKYYLLLIVIFLFIHGITALT